MHGSTQKVRRRAVEAAAAACLVVTATSCGVGPTRTIDPSSAEKHISAEIASRYSVTTPPVTCPSGVADRRGSRFTCTASLDGQQLTLVATVSAPSGSFDLSPVQAVVPVAGTESRLETQIDQTTGHRPVVTCPYPQHLLVLSVGATFSCSAVFPGEKARSVTVTVVDAGGGYTFDLAPPG